MNIYVDFDDCLCETAKAFSGLVRDMFGIYVPYDNMQYFNLQMAFGLTDEQYKQLLAKGHEPEVLLAYEETPGAADTVNNWLDCGHNISIITGRPFSSYEPSRAWLDTHGFKNVRLFCFDKYGRENIMKNTDFSLTTDDYYKMRFDYAVEDSPSAFKFFDHMPELKVMVFDRPWNRSCELPGDNYRRCSDWESIRKLVV